MHSTGRRLAAARALGAYKSVEALADALRLPNFGARTIREVEADRRGMHPHEIEAVARLVGVSPAFFTADLSVIPTTITEPEAPAFAVDLAHAWRDAGLEEQQIKMAAEVLAQAIRQAAAASEQGTASPPEGRDERDRPRRAAGGDA